MNNSLRGDLRNYFKYKRNYLYRKLFFKLDKYIPTPYERHLDNVFEDFERVLYMESITGSDRVFATDMPYKLSDGSTRYFRPYIKFDDFISYIMIYKKDSKLQRQLNRLDKCYDAFQSCRAMYLISGVDQFIVKANVRYLKPLRKVFMRFRANPACVEHAEECKDLEVIIDIGGVEDDIHDGSNS